MNGKSILHPDRMISSGSDVLTRCEKADFTLLPLHPDHIKLLHTLNRAENTPPHNNPFDRMLICQAKADDMLFITNDGLIPDYNEPCIVSV